MQTEMTYKTLRDEIAIEALNALLVSGNISVWEPDANKDRYSRIAYQWADAMLKVREEAK
jgi:hypothetical protein